MKNLVVVSVFLAAGMACADFSVYSEGNDQQWSGDGTSPANVSATTLRVGSQVANYVTGAVLPFLLPDLSGASITNVTLDFTVTGSNIGNLDAPYNAYLDLVAPHAGAVASSVTAASDISGTVLVDNYIKLTVANFPANSTYSYTVSGGTLTSYLQGIYATDPDAAGKYVMLTLVADTPIRGGRYFTMASGDATSQQPTLNITASSPQVTFTEDPSVVLTNNGNGTVTFTMTLGAADADPAPVLSGELTLDGSNVTVDMTNLIYTAAQTAQPQILVWTVTATNGVYQDAVISITNLIPSLFGTAPDQVTGLTVDAGDAQNTLAWVAPADNGEAITDYLIEVNNGSGYTTLADGVSTATNYLHDTVTNGVTYTYRVAAVNGLGAIGPYSEPVSGTPVEFLMEPSFVVQPLFDCVNNGDGTMTCTMDTGTVTSAPPATVSGVLTLDGTNITAAITNGVYTASLQPDPATLVWTVTASNGVGSNAVFSVSQVIPSINGITIKEFSRNMSIFDSDCARGNNRADIPLSGTTPFNGTVIEARPVYADSGTPLSNLDWQVMSTAAGGAWSGSYTGVYRTTEWLRMEVRVQGSGDDPVQMSNTFAAGYVVFLEDQSNTHRGLLTVADYAAANAAATNGPFPVTIGNQPGDFQVAWLGDDGNSHPAIKYISDANPFTTSVAAMAATFAQTAPGLKVMIGFDTLSGSAPAAPLNDTDTSRNWTNSVWLANLLQADGSEVGAAWADHFQGTTDSTTWLVGVYLGRNLDGTLIPSLPLGLDSFSTQIIAGSKVNHIWPSIYPGLLTGRMQILRGSQGNTYAKEINADDFTVSSGVSPKDTTFADHFGDSTGFFGQLVQPEGDVHWDNADVERGMPQKFRAMAAQYLRTGGFVNVPVPTIDHVEYTPEHITVWSDAGPVTTIRLLKGLTNNFPVDPTADPQVEGDLQVIGFTDELMQNVARTEIVDENGNPAIEGRIRIYPVAGKTFTDSSRLFYLIANSGYLPYPGVSQQEYTDSYLYDCYPIVDVGIPTMFGQILQAPGDKFGLSKSNDLPVAEADFTVGQGNPRITGTGYLYAQSKTNLTVEVEFRRQLGQPFYFASADNTYWMGMNVSAWGGITVQFRDNSGANYFNATVPYTEMPSTVDGFHTLRMAMDLGDGRVDLSFDGNALDSSSAPQFGTNTGMASGIIFRNTQNLNVFDFNSGGDVRRLRVWPDYSSGGATPSSTPWLEVVADSSGAFVSPAGGRYDVLDYGVARTNGLSVATDTDNDGIPDSWEMQYFGGSTNANASALSANGLNTIRQAYIAGLDPTNPASLFTVSNDWKTLRWTAVSGRVYSVYWTTNLLESFQPLETNMVWPQNSWTGTQDQVDGFYRLSVQLEP